jgi:hypothetical protein
VISSVASVTFQNKNTSLVIHQNIVKEYVYSGLIRFLKKWKIHDLDSSIWTIITCWKTGWGDFQKKYGLVPK